jgi:hypothetical protein
MYEWTRDVPKDQSIVILSSLIRCDTWIVSTGWVELIFSGIADPGREPEEEPLRRYDVDGINPVTSIYISSS